MFIITAESADRSLLRDGEIDAEHEEHTDDEADVEVDRRRPALHASQQVIASSFFLPLLPIVAVVRMRREGSEGFNLEKRNAQHQLTSSKCRFPNGQACIDFNKVLVSHFI